MPTERGKQSDARKGKVAIINSLLK